MWTHRHELCCVVALVWFCVVNFTYAGMFFMEYYGLFEDYDLRHQIPRWMEESDYELMMSYFTFIAFGVTLLGWTAFAAVRVSVSLYPFVVSVR